jgi:DNA repair ATPase RecN
MNTEKERTEARLASAMITYRKLLQAHSEALTRARKDMLKLKINALAEEIKALNVDKATFSYISSVIDDYEDMTQHGERIY